jgi:adenylate cyclase
VEAAATIAVLPFENPSGDPEQEYFARGFVEDVVTELSRFPTLEVIHPKTSFTLGGSRTPDGLRIGYRLLGSVRRLGETVRVTAQLVEGDAGWQVWADRFDAPAERLLEVQDEIVARVASTLAGRIDSARLHQARRKPLSSLEVYDCWLRGLDCLRRGSVRSATSSRCVTSPAASAAATRSGMP